ncbi:MAG: GlsB/YeaQ/YmgE family stress response membrane protein [Anaerolineae bacterium]|nr:GlsB/YeaQ/YmgE family stress response membrane protein [Anaerolineae bacterium]
MSPALVNVIVWGVLGLLVSLAVILLTRPENNSRVFLDLLVGVIGAIIGGFILRLFNVIGDADLQVIINVPSAIVALVGAVILVVVAEWLQRATQ